MTPALGKMQKCLNILSSKPEKQRARARREEKREEKINEKNEKGSDGHTQLNRVCTQHALP